MWEMQWPALIVFIAFIVLGIIDLGFVVFRGTGGTISNAMVQMGIRAPFWPFVVGAVCGHLLWYMQPVGCTDHFTPAYQIGYYALLAFAAGTGVIYGRSKYGSSPT